MDDQTSGDTGRGGVFTHSILMALERLTNIGQSDFSCGMMYNAAVEANEVVFRSAQDRATSLGIWFVRGSVYVSSSFLLLVLGLGKIWFSVVPPFLPRLHLCFFVPWEARAGERRIGEKSQTEVEEDLAIAWCVAHSLRTLDRDGEWVATSTQCMRCRSLALDEANSVPPRVTPSIATNMFCVRR